MNRVYKQWACLDHRPFRALAYMALVSLDKDDPPKYWGGRDAIAVALGYDMPDEPAIEDHTAEAEEARATRVRSQKGADKVTQALVKEGALLRIRHGNFRSNAVFALLFPAVEVPLQGVPTTDKLPPQATSEVPPQGAPRYPLKGSVGTPSVGLKAPPEAPPKEYEEKKGASEGMRGHPRAGPAPRAKLKSLPAASSQNIEEERLRQSKALQERIKDFGKETA